jgi:hypothetical protein
MSLGLELFAAFLCYLIFSVIFCHLAPSFVIPSALLLSLQNIVSPVLPDYLFQEVKMWILLIHHLSPISLIIFESFKSEMDIGFLYLLRTYRFSALVC